MDYILGMDNHGAGCDGPYNCTCDPDLVAQDIRDNLPNYMVAHGHGWFLLADYGMYVGVAKGGNYQALAINEDLTVGGVDDIAIIDPDMCSPTFWEAVVEASEVQL